MRLCEGEFSFVTRAASEHQMITRAREASTGGRIGYLHIRACATRGHIAGFKISVLVVHQDLKPTKKVLQAFRSGQDALNLVGVEWG